MVERTKLVPPDGGYGWMIVAAYALHHFIITAIFQGFGLIFKDKFKDLEMSQKDISFIMATHSGFTMFLGIFLGPLLKKFGYRKIAFMGATCMTTGMILLSFGNSFAYFFIIYGFFTAIGRGVGLSAYPLALNTFFLKNRNRAAGYTMTAFGLGPVIMPQVFSILVDTFGVTGGALIVAGIAGNTFVASCLLQPVNRYLKIEIIEDDVKEPEEKKLLHDGIELDSKDKSKSIENIRSVIETDIVTGLGSHLDESMQSLYSAITERSMSISSRRNTLPDQKSIETQKIEERNLESKAKNNEHSVWKDIGKRLVDIFDLTLLRDATYVNTALGMALSFFSEQNFVLLTPFIVQDYGLNTQQIATFMSIISGLDICFRFLSPYAIEFFKQPVRVMYIFSLIVPILSKFSLLFASDYTSLLCCAVFLGIARGLRVVYFQLLIPSHVPIERLASAIGLQSTLSSVFICIGGPLLGMIKDATGSFAGCIFVLNAVTFLAIVMWTVELLYKSYKTKTKPERVEKGSMLMVDVSKS